MFHELLKAWFHLVESTGYLGVFFLMALESSIFPIPSEIVIPPAAYFVTQGKFTYTGVILAGTFGSYFGSAVTFYISRWLGLPFILKFGRFFFIKPSQIESASDWVKDYGVFGVFFARLLPVIRHLISIPAGILNMNFKSFSFYTITGAFIWCSILTFYGAKVIGGNPELLQSPENLVSALKSELHWIVLGILVMAVLFIFVKLKMKKPTLISS